MGGNGSSQVALASACSANQHNIACCLTGRYQPTKMKQRRAHIVPLALQSVAIYRRDSQHQEIR